MNSTNNGHGVYEEDHHNSHHNLSRLSMCSKPDEDDQEELEEDEDDSNDALSLESFSDSEKEPGYGCLSLPITPPRMGRSLPISIRGNNAKEYASENEGEKQSRTKQRNLRRRSSTFNRESLLEKCNLEKKKMEADAEEEEMMNVITRPKEKRRSLGINVEEAKASRDLGFGLEIPSRLSVSCCPSPVWDMDDTNSGGNSPISNWKISSPGDDPNAVKARLKLWAHAVAAASTSPSN
ncbi:hypothetical protein ACHQM5_010242 [Ranunculus cassubicifolius]